MCARCKIILNMSRVFNMIYYIRILFIYPSNIWYIESNTNVYDWGNRDILLISGVCTKYAVFLFCRVYIGVWIMDGLILYMLKRLINSSLFIFWYEIQFLRENFRNEYPINDIKNLKSLNILYRLIYLCNRWILQILTKSIAVWMNVRWTSADCWQNRKA